MAELSTKRSDFYKQTYFPSVYYGEVFELTLEEAKDLQAAQRDLTKLAIEADQNLARLSETFRERALTPQGVAALKEAQGIVDQDLKDREARQKGTAALYASPAKGALTAIDLGIQQAKGDAPSLSNPDKAKVIGKEVASAIRGKDPAIQRRIYVDVIAKYGAALGGDALNALRASLQDPGLTYESIKKQASSPEDQAKLGAKAPLPPQSDAASKAQATLDATRSPFQSGSVEQTSHVAAGISDEEDDLLRLYLSRIQDKESPGVVTDTELAANPQLAEAEAVYNKVKAAGSFQKSAAEWFSSEYLSALRTADSIDKKAKSDPFGGLDPYRWAQREALKRGGYTKESLLHMRMLEERPDIAPYVSPAFARLRDAKGLDPKNASEAVIREAFAQNPNITIDELDAILNNKRQGMIQQGRQDAREAGKEGRQMARLGRQQGVEYPAPGSTPKGERRGSREVANDLYSPENAEAAKAYLLALRLNKAGTKAEPDAGSKIVAPPPSQSELIPTPKEVAKADANRQIVAAKAAIPDEVDLNEQSPTAAIPESNWDKALGQTVDDPTGAGWAYTRRGGKLYAIPRSEDRLPIPVEVIEGTPAYAAIQSALTTGQVPKAPTAKPKAPPSKPKAPTAPAPETDFVGSLQTPPRVNFAQYPQATTTPSQPSPPPPPPPKTKLIRDPVTGKVVRLQE